MCIRDSAGPVFVSAARRSPRTRRRTRGSCDEHPRAGENLNRNVADTVSNRRRFEPDLLCRCASTSGRSEYRGRQTARRQAASTRARQRTTQRGAATNLFVGGTRGPRHLRVQMNAPCAVGSLMEPSSPNSEDAQNRQRNRGNPEIKKRAIAVGVFGRSKKLDRDPEANGEA